MNVMASIPFVNVTLLRKRCILCHEGIHDDEEETQIKSDGLATLQSLAKRWNDLDERLCTDSPYKEYRLCKNRLDLIENNDNIWVHKNCRISFRNRIHRKELSYNKLSNEAPTEVDEISN